MKKKILIVGIVLLIMLTLFGCSSGSSNSSNATPTKLSLVLSQSTATVTIGSTDLKLLANENNGSLPIVWSSENDSIATVSQDGVVSPNQPGTTNIVATVQGTDVTATCQVVVEGIPEIILNKYNINGFVSTTTIPITATTEKPGAISWETSNPAVATVDQQGQVSLVGVGQATISAIQASTGAVATCIVTVQKPTITLSQTTLNVNPKSSPVQLTATTNATGAITWTSSTPSVATVSSSGLVTFLKAGAATITATQTGTNVSATCSVTVTNILTLPASYSGVFGSSTTLTPTYTDPGALTWSSSAPSIVSVDSSGKITLVGVGSATIKVSQASTGLSATCPVTVSASGTISLSRSSVTISQSNGYYNLIVTPSVPGAISYTTNNPNLVSWTTTSTGITISTRGTAGTCTITASQASTGATATITVYMVAEKISPNVTFPLTLHVGQTQQIQFIDNLTIATISAQIAPINGYFSYTWTADPTDPSIITGTITAKAVGTGGFIQVVNGGYAIPGAIFYVDVT